MIERKDLRDAERVVLGLSAVVFGLLRIWRRHDRSKQWFERKRENPLGGAPSFERRQFAKGGVLPSSLPIHDSHWSA